MQTEENLQWLKRKYSGALYSFLRIADVADTCEKFLKNPSRPPVFRYDDNLTLEKIRNRLRRIKADLAALNPDEAAAKAFLEYRLSETELLENLWELREQKKISTRAYNEFRLRQNELYGSPDMHLFSGVIENLRYLAAHKHNGSLDHLYKEIEERLGTHSRVKLYKPTPETFHFYKELHRKAFPELYEVISSIKKRTLTVEDIKGIFEEALAAVGADKDGWEVVIASRGANISVSRHMKRVIISQHLNPATILRIRQMVAHEVGCHVLRAMNKRVEIHQAAFDESDEGLAIVLEQLLASRFAYKRAIRYIAVCLAYGVDGEPRNFCQVYEIIWRACVIVGHDEKLAKERAFYETARIFRGGLPNVAGIAYLKDKIYLESNIFAWEKLESRLLDEKEFAQLFTGHDNMLTRYMVP